jgi:hypothetical protein
VRNEFTRLKIQELDFIYAKAFIHHLFTEEQKKLFSFLKRYMIDEKSFIYLYNQFIPKDIEELNDDLIITNVLNIITDYFQKLTKIREDS